MSEFVDASERHQRHRASRDRPIVGIGASAGGIDALEAFFEGLPPNPDLAFVVVTHLSPDRERNLLRILQRHADLAVQEASHGLTPEANSVYVRPPSAQLRIEDGQFQLDEATDDAERSRVVDTFFRSLAADQKDGAVGIVLSGAGADGALGLRALRENGGLTMVQAPEDAACDGMPRSALDSGFVDVEDAAEALGTDLPAYWTHAAAAPESPEDLAAAEEEVLSEIFARLHTETGHDFSRYKRSSVLRRIQRRMAVQRTATLSAYLEELSQNPEEVRVLYRELLIGVTSFFRDSEAFEALEQTVVPTLFEDKDHDDRVRVWSAGCATGEEAYSLAMLLDEFAATLEEPPDIQVFATDPSPSAIAHARKGRYSESIVSGLSAARRTRHLRPDGEAYQVRPSLRNRVLFAEHNLLTDPPFPRIDLISCRNVLIYLQRSVHEHILRRFHYALRPNGYLFLGSSESASAAPELFSRLDAHSSLLRRQATEQTTSWASFVLASSDLPEKQSPAPPENDSPLPLLRISSRPTGTRSRKTWPASSSIGIGRSSIEPSPRRSTCTTRAVSPLTTCWR